VLLVVALALVPERAHAREPIVTPMHDRWEFLDPRAPNLASLGAITLSDFAGVEFGYRRAVGRHMSVGALFEYAYPNPGYAQLIGFGHTLEVAGWIKRPWNGLFVAVGLTVGHQFLYRLPELRTVALGGGLSIGWAWDVTAHVNVTLSGGLRRMGIIDRSTQICTITDQCIFASQEYEPRFALTFAYRF
jgi:hypothetical protein